MTLRRRHTSLLLGPLLVVACSSATPGEGPTATSGAALSTADGTWMVHALGARCWDLGGPTGSPYSGAPVTLRRCDSKSPTPAQQIRVMEIGDGSHDVALGTPALKPGLASSLCITVIAEAGIFPNAPLRLLPCQTDKATGQPIARQRFAYDGDAFLAGTQTSGYVTRDFVVAPLERVTTEGVPLALTQRETSDAEYFRMTPVAATYPFPTSGFVRVGTEPELEAALKRGWGTVIEIVPKSVSLRVTGAPKLVHAGQTVRGYRKGLNDGPLIDVPNLDTGPGALFQVQESHVRISGMRLQGPSEAITPEMPQHRAIEVNDDPARPLADVFIDHIQGYAWTEAVVAVNGKDFSASMTCPASVPRFPRPASIHIANNFLHQNQMWGYGYGAVFYNGGYGLVSRNVMYGNRHQIAGDFTATTGYVADHNFVLSENPDYLSLGYSPTPDFDKHGRGSGDPDDHGWMGGYSEDYVEYTYNTFLGTNRSNIFERGTPCGYTSIALNGFRSQPAGTFLTPPIKTLSEDSSKDHYFSNAFAIPDPTADLRVGDFDGDGRDDVFAATGNTWWFSSGAQSEWRFLNGAPDTADHLRFGDLDADGRTDVIAVHGSNVDVSWAGGTAAITINTLPAGGTIDDVAVGDFDGDGVTDLFFASGTEWLVAPGGRGGWQHFATSTYRAKELLFGDFDGDRKTDVLGYVAGQWEIVKGGGSTWMPWNAQGGSDLGGLRVGDFDGDGAADVIRATGGRWQISSRAAGAFVTIRNTNDNLTGKAIGRFDADLKSDVLPFEGLHLFLASGGRDPISNLSIHDMR